MPGAIPAVVPFGTPSVRGLLDANELVQCPSLEIYCASGGRNDFRVVEGDFDATTGRAVLQWTPNDNVQLYASWTRGYKPGGFNPRTLTALNIPLTFDSEVIKAYEVGVKSNIFDGVLQANLTGFYYDYSGLQVFAHLRQHLDQREYRREGVGHRGRIRAAPDRPPHRQHERRLPQHLGRRLLDDRQPRPDGKGRRTPNSSRT